MTTPTKTKQRQSPITRPRIERLTTKQAKKELDISHPLARVFKRWHDLNLPVVSASMGGRSAYLLL